MDSNLYKPGQAYQSPTGDIVNISGINKSRVYYESSTKPKGLIDSIGRYFMLTSITDNELKQINN